MKRPPFVSVFVTFPLLFTSYPMTPLWYSKGTVTSTSMIGSKIDGDATSYAAVQEYFVQI